MMTMAKRAIIEALLERETEQRGIVRRVKTGATVNPSAQPPLLPGQNAIWREKVINWYFSIVSALNRQHQASSSGRHDVSLNPFTRNSVHVTTALLDSYLLSLPSEHNLRFRRDRSAYQLLATTSLLVGMRLTREDLVNESRANQVRQEVENSRGGGLKRTQTLRQNMNQQADSQDVPSPLSNTGHVEAVPLPNATALLRISAAPKSISEKNVLLMVRELTGSRVFPRAKLASALDFIRAFCSSSTIVDDVDNEVSLGALDAEEAYRVADASLRDVTLCSCRPSIVACAAITIALLRSDDAHHNMSSLRCIVYRSIYGNDASAALIEAIRKLELRLLRVTQEAEARARRNEDVIHGLPPSTTTHIIPLEDD